MKVWWKQYSVSCFPANCSQYYNYFYGNKPNDGLNEHIYRLTKIYYPFHIEIYPWSNILQVIQLEGFLFSFFHTHVTNVKTKWRLNDCILFIVLVEQWKTAYLVKELLWKKSGYQTTFFTSLVRPESTKPKIISKLNYCWSHIIKDCLL